MKSNKFLSDEAVESEIKQLLTSPYVKLAKKEERNRYKRRNYLYCLRQLEKKGKALHEAGYTMESLELEAKNIELAMSGEYEEND